MTGASGPTGPTGATGSTGSTGATGPVFLSQVTLADGATITPNFTMGNSFTLALGASGHLLANPSNISPGEAGVFIINAGTTPYTMLVGTAYLFNAPYSNSVPPALGPGNNVLTVVAQGTATLLAVLQSGTFS
jgi:hypothetical protein